MNGYDFVMIEGDNKPKMIYTPYIWAVIREYSLCYTVDNGKEITVIEKKQRRRSK